MVYKNVYGCEFQVTIKIKNSCPPKGCEFFYHISDAGKGEHDLAVGDQSIVRKYFWIGTGFPVAMVEWAGRMLQYTGGNNMFTIRGEYNSAKVFADALDENATQQILKLCNQPFVESSKIRIMPDAHAGAGCTVGTTMTIKDKVVPNLVGVDIGCGMMVAVIDAHKDEINFDQLDEVIRKYIPSGFNIRNTPHPLVSETRIHDVIAPVDRDRAEKSIGTLGGGNHFIELNEWDDQVALVVHSGSRHFGKQIAEYYQDLAYNELTEKVKEKQSQIEKLKKEGRHDEAQQVLEELKELKTPKDLAYLQGDSFKAYMHDMEIAQEYAMLNRKAMIQEIVKHMDWSIIDSFTTIHNYIDMENMILRKGAISAQKGERVIIPMNMRDGSIIAVGKGNPDWNYSAPHGAGRIMSRSKARRKLSVNEFRKTMKGIWSTSVGRGTLDESPMAYKPMDDIIKHTDDTIKIEKIIKPIYNFKAS